MSSSPLVSVIIPIYNSESFLEACLRSVSEQTIAPNKLEVLLVDDGSTDKSPELLRAAAEKDSRLRVFTQKNAGQSAARNLALKNARGKYLFFLDSDDTISPGTIEAVSSFFEEHYAETDLVTYPLVKVTADGVRSKPNSRYDILKKTGVYNLNEVNNAFIAQSSMNICVKNHFEENPLFDECPWQEDMKFCIETVLPKMTLGFCAECEYLYLAHASSTVATKFYSYYIFEQTLGFFEALFSRFRGEVPLCVQGYYLNDYAWKSKMDILLPYHYDAEGLASAKARLDALSSRLSAELVTAAPYLDESQKCFFLKRIFGSLSVAETNGALAVFGGGVRLFDATASAQVYSIKIKNSNIIIRGFTTTPLVLSEGFALFARCGGNSLECSLARSNHTPCFGDETGFDYYEFTAELPCDKAAKIELVAALGGRELPCELSYSEYCALNSDRGVCLSGKYLLKKGNGCIFVSRAGAVKRLAARIKAEKVYLSKYKKAFLFRLLHFFAPRGRVWLYSDRDGFTGNAALQFKADFSRRDGIKRYYISNSLGERESFFTPEEKKQLVPFGSRRHIRLWYAAEKLLTSFVEKEVLTPFGAGPLRHYADLPSPEIIYLQHGVMHADLRRLYSREICGAEKITVSTAFEKEKLLRGYNYAPTDLIESGMPSLDLVDVGHAPLKKILFAPSWRKNLIGAYSRGKREPNPDSFKRSAFFNEISAFLRSPELDAMLKEHGYTLEFKNHPIFECYNSLFDNLGERVSIVTGDCNLGDYALMITDFSSMMFDFVYLKRPVICFIPDEELFRAGVAHSYRALDLPPETFADVTESSSELVSLLKNYFESGFRLTDAQAARAESFFLRRGGHRDALYEALK